MKCAYHPERAALGYCANCGKSLCSACLVRLSTGNYCRACASPQDRPLARRRLPWWVIALVLLAALILVRGLIR